MNRGLLNLVVDLLAACCLLVLLATGYILRFPLPPTTNRTHELWGMSRHEWGTIHSWTSLVVLAVLCTHVVLHWEWLFATIRRRFTTLKAPTNQRRTAGIATMAAILVAGGMFAWAAHSGVREKAIPLHPLRESGGDVTTLLEPVPPAVISQQDVMAIFERSCIGCHGANRPRSGFRVDRRDAFFAPGDNHPLIVPGSADTSRLIEIVSGKLIEMKSAAAHRLPADEIALLKAWINAGADWPEHPSAPRSVEGP